MTRYYYPKSIASNEKFDCLQPAALNKDLRNVLQEK